MKLVPTQEQLDLQAMLRSVLTKECPTSLVRELKLDESDGFPASLWDALTTTGVLGLAFDESYGGSASGLFELGLCFAEAGRALCPTIVYSTLLFGVGVARLADERQRAQYLPALCSGQLKASIATWNPADAGDLRPTLTAIQAEGGWTLRGTVLFLANAAIADVVLVTATTTVFAEPARTLGFLIEPNSVGWHSDRLETMAGDKQSRVTLADVFVREESVLAGSAGHGLAAADLAWIASTALALQCMEMVGGTSAVLEQTVDYVKNREQFGRPIASFQAVQHLVADIHIALQGARLAAHQAIWWLARGEPATRAVAIAKMHCSETYKWATLTAHQLHGGMGYIRETDLHLWSERAKVTEIQGGTADVAAGWLQKEIGLVR